MASIQYIQQTCLILGSIAKINRTLHEQCKPSLHLVFGLGVNDMTCTDILNILNILRNAFYTEMA